MILAKSLRYCTKLVGISGYSTASGCIGAYHVGPNLWLIIDVKDIDALRQDLVLPVELLGHHFELHTTWGLFSPKAIDEGSELLLEHLSPVNGERVLDIGCGYGTLGLPIARQVGDAVVHLVDKDFVAVDYARANAERHGLNNVEVYLSNGLSAIPADFGAQLVVSNLPAKVGNELFYIMFVDAFERMAPGGRIVVVTINGLRSFIKRAFTEVFGNYKKVKQGRSYTISMAEKRA